MIVVTGGAGFIGSHLVAALEERGARDTLVCDRLGRGEKWRNLAKREISGLVPPERLLDHLRESGADVEAVLHMGAISETTEPDADLLIENNFALTLTLWRWCAANGVRFIYASSAATYGDGADGFDDDGTPEGLARLRPGNAYAWSKHLVDRRIARLVSSGAAAPPQSVGLKFFNVYGANEFHKGAQRSLVHQAWEQAAAGRPVRLFRSHCPDVEDGGQLRDFVYVEDCVAAMVWLLDHPEVSGQFNLGTGLPRTFHNLVLAVFAAMNRRPEIEFSDTPEALRRGYQYYTCARMERLRAAGFDRPFASLEDGVASTVRGFLEAEDPYR